MAFYADLHLHSPFSRATSRECSLEGLAFWAARKGVAVLATGDFTHPGRLAELKEKLVPAEPGLFRLRPEIERAVRGRPGAPEPGRAWSASVSPTVGAATARTASRGAAGEALPAEGLARFMLQVEISTIYKKGERTRKIHHLIYVPDLGKAEHVAGRLARVGNITSDGRPILGLDSRDLLEIALEAGGGSYLVPAHVWTPWFALLGSKSGFDAVEECYGDLTGEIFALETGLSSDPPMNWRFSALDRYRLVSNSDAHSPGNIGREACVFETAMDYFSMRRALETGVGYGGTVEFFPEEGKYHLDGHRKCGTRLTPGQTRANEGRCPVCGRPVTVGVMHRVEALADRPEGTVPDAAASFRSLVPLAELVSEIRGVGPKTKTVQRVYERLLARLGPELAILNEVPVGEIRAAGFTLLAEAIERMRAGRVRREAGYDGEYGTIRLFEPGELEAQGGGLLFDLGKAAPAPVEEQRAAGPAGAAKRAPGAPDAPDARAPSPRPLGRAAGGDAGRLDALDPDQRAAAEIVGGPLLIVAGPGTGKTRTLTHRIARLVSARRAPPEACLAITFTRRAAREMAERLERLIPGAAARVPVMTFHALGFSILREHGERLGLGPSFRVAEEEERIGLLRAKRKLSERKARKLLEEVSRAKRSPGRAAGGVGRGHMRAIGGSDRAETARNAHAGIADAREGARRPTAPARAVETYERAMRAAGWVDFDDLILLSARLLEEHPGLAEEYRKRWRWVSVDEYQDIDEGQYRLVRLLVPPDGNLCAIGDPDQGIYSFRGASVRFFGRFAEDFPAARTVRLTRNYRSGRSIVAGALQVIAPSALVEERVLEALVEDETRVVIHESATDRAEAEFVVHAVEQMLGGTTFFSMDSGRAGGESGEGLSFSDFAVLYRTRAQADALCEAFARSGMPFQARSHARLSEEPAVGAIVRLLREMTPEGPVAERLPAAAAAAAREGLSEVEARLVAEALAPVAERCGEDLDRFLSELALGADVDLWNPRADRVTLLTLHAAKGLEFRVVFLTGCEDGVLPLRWGRSEETDLAEERRLFFVGMTRARERLFLTRARRRLWRGKIRETAPSPFLRDIEERLLERRASQARRKRRGRPDDQMQLF